MKRVWMMSLTPAAGLPKRRASSVGIALATVLAAFAPAPLSAQPPATASFRALLNEEWQHELSANPETASVLGDLRYNDRWSDYSAAHAGAERAANAAFLARFEAIAESDLSEDDRLNRTLMIGQLRNKVKAYDLKLYEMPVYLWRSSTPLLLSSMVADFPFGTVKEYEDYLTRLKAIPTVLDQTEDVARQGLRDGLMPPKFLLEKLVPRIGEIADTAGQQSIFAQPLNRFPASISPADQARLRTQILSAIDTIVRPAYHKFGQFLAKDYAPHGRSEPGLWALPNGDALYRFLVAEKTTTSATPEEIHAKGLAEVARIEGDMTAITRAQGYPDLARFWRELKSDPRTRATSREALLASYRAWIAQMEPDLLQLVRTLPKTRLEVVAVEPALEHTAPIAEYHSGTIDGSRPGQVHVNTGDIAHRTTIIDEATAYHEGIPGHHLQISLAQELQDVPAFRRQESEYTAFVEGWALYAESLGKDVGFYRDPVSDFGRLASELLRADRLVLDTGVHYKHWTRDQMVAFFRTHASVDEPDVQAETDRYITLPGQALAYKMGQLKILELRERAQRAFGCRFDIRDFHDSVLDAGALPLDVLEKRIDAWIAATNRPDAPCPTPSTR